jgi:hypothetical protein
LLFVCNGEKVDDRVRLLNAFSISAYEFGFTDHFQNYFTFHFPCIDHKKARLFAVWGEYNRLGSFTKQE